MTNKEMIFDILNDHSCLTAQEIKGFINRKYNTIISNQSISAAIRPAVSAGLAEKGVSPTNNKTVYWLTSSGKEVWNNG